MPARNGTRGAAASASILVLVAAAVLVGGGAAPLTRLAADAALRLSTHWPPPAPDAPDVAIVAIDPQSLRAYPDWPWPRDHHARVVDRLSAAGAAAIAFDVDFSTPRSGDDAFAAAIARSGRVVLAAFRQLQPLQGGGELEIASVPVRTLAESAAAIGSVLLPMDPDGMVRRSARASPIAGVVRPPLAGAALGIATGDPTALSTGSGTQTFPIDYRRGGTPIPEIPIADVIDGRFDPARVQGRVVLVGATAVEFQDLWSTPLGPARPGVWIQALVLRTLAAERAGAPVLHAVPAPAVLALTALCVGMLAAFAGARSSVRIAVLAALGIAVGVGALALLVRTGAWVDPVLPWSALALQYVLGLERVRARVARLASDRERRLTALSQVGAASTAPRGADPMSVALSLLGDVLDARAVALLRAGEDGTLDGRRIDWLRRTGAAPAGDAKAAAAALASREIGALPSPGRGLAVYAPLFAGDVAVGVLVVERDGEEPLDASELRTVATVGAQIALSAENLRLIDGLRRSFDSTVEAIAGAVEARDGYTELHCRRLAVFSVLMAERLGLPPDEVEAIRLGALLHDVGKIGIRDEVLLKPGRFDPEERREMERHTEVGHRIVSPIHGLTATTVACVRHHHERWDGAGYPDGLAGEAIPLGARIVALVDVWDALSTARPYKAAYPQPKVLEILEKGRGTSFEPRLVDLFLRILDEEGEEMLELTRRGASA